MNIMPVKGENMTSGNVPAFLTKLWNLVENPVYDYLIAWDVTGNSFHVFDQGRFAKEILPMYFKHNNMASFIRQLNMYGFRKVVHIEQGLKTETDDVEFQHPFFKKGEEQLLELIKRKISGHHPPTNVKVEPVGVKVKPEDVSKVLNDVRMMKGKQETMNSKLESMKRENEVLWRELASLRQKHMKQQQIVNKLIQFLVHLVGGNRGLKRSLPLMISGTSNNESTIAKIPKYEPGSQYSVQSPPDLSFMNDQNLSGPTIHDVTDIIQGSDVTDNTSNLEPTSSGAGNMKLSQDFVAPTEMATSGDSSNSSSSRIDISDLSTNLGSNITDLPDQILSAADNNTINVPLSTPQASSSSLSALDSSDKQAVRSLSRQSSISEMSEHLESLHYDLEGLKDVLTSNQYNFDPRTLLGIFTPDTQQQNQSETVDTMFKELDPDSKDGNDHHESSLLDSSTGSELVQYKTGDDDVLPALFDLADLSHYDSDLEGLADDQNSGNTGNAGQKVKLESNLSDELD